HQCRAARGSDSGREISENSRDISKVSRSADRTGPRCPRSCDPGFSSLFCNRGECHSAANRREKETRVTIGILGGGQLGYMLALAGYPLGLHFRFFDPSPEAPVGRIASRVTAEFLDRSALEKFSSGLELVTFEFENVPVAAARFLAEHVPVYPSPSALETAQDRLREKQLFQK